MERQIDSTATETIATVAVTDIARAFRIISDEEDAKRERARNERAYRERLSIAIQEDSLPPGIERYAIIREDVRKNNPQATRYIEEWVRRQGNIYLWGPEGTGKTALCRFLLLKAIRANLSAREVKAASFCGGRFSGYNGEQQWRPLIGICLLLIDDLADARYAANGLKRVIEARGDRGFPTLFTSNLSRADLVSMWRKREYPELDAVGPGSLVARINPCRVFEITGESLRKNR